VSDTDERIDLAARLSVVLLTYNCAHRIVPILDRLRALDIPLVAVDNGSSDGTADMLQRTGVRTLALDRNIGAAARNHGLAAIDTEFVVFCDDDGWYDRTGLSNAVSLLAAYPRLALVNARIVVGPDADPDPISDEMADSPVPDRAGIPGGVLLSFMAGASVARVAALEDVGGYDTRFFIGGEEEELAMRLAKAGWQMRYSPDVVMHHMPSVANARNLRAYGIRNTLWTAWLHRRFPSAVRHTLFTLLDRPKNRDLARGLALALAGLPWVIRERDPMSAELDADYAILDAGRFARRRPVLTFKENYGDPVALNS
jgi:GT2 family glycosyltransferase